MSGRTWTLTDVENGTHEADFCISAREQSGGAGQWSISQRTLRGGLCDGVDLVVIDNGLLRLMVLPTRGMGIWKATVGNDTLGWQSPVRGPVHPQFVPLFESSGLGWLEGFDEFLVRCGLESNGAPEFDAQGQLIYPLHGRIANRPAHFVDVTVDEDAGTITLRGFVEETRFHFQKLRLVATLTTSIGSSSFTIQDEVENFGGTPAQMQMLYHINLGEPLLAPGDQFVAPVRAIQGRDEAATSDIENWNQYGPAIAGQAEQCFFLELAADESSQTQVLLKNAAGTAGTALKFDTSSLPSFTLWKNLVASADGYVTGLEPATNLPNTRSEELAQGRVVSLQPGETWSSEIVIDRLMSAAAVGDVEAAIQALGGKDEAS